MVLVSVMMTFPGEQTQQGVPMVDAPRSSSHERVEGVSRRRIGLGYAVSRVTQLILERVLELEWLLRQGNRDIYIIPLRVLALGKTALQSRSPLRASECPGPDWISESRHMHHLLHSLLTLQNL